MQSLGDRMKFYEVNNATPIMPNTLPFVVRLDGKAFHTFTKGLEKPYHTGLSLTFERTMIELIKLSGAKFGYTQSDEISLFFYNAKHTSQYFMGGKRDKLNSVLTSYCSVVFNNFIKDNKISSRMALFDARTFFLPNLYESMNCLLWRVDDAIRNSIQGLAQSLYSHKQLVGKSLVECRQMIIDKGRNWDNCIDAQKYGIIVKATGEYCHISNKLNEKIDWQDHYIQELFYADSREE